jgi:hypothetical protein
MTEIDFKFEIYNLSRSIHNFDPVIATVSECLKS